MKRIVFLLLPLLFAACATKTDRLELIDWQFEYNNQWYPATVPGFIHTDLLANGLIPDPYYGTNEDSVRWVGDSSWSYRTTILGNNLPKGPLYLVMEGLAGNALVLWVAYCGDGDPDCGTETVDNMFTKNVFEISNGTLQYDSIVIEVFFEPLTDSLREADYGIPLPDRRAFTRIAPYQQGWDWGPKLPTCGIWKPVYITNKPASPPGVPSARPTTPLRSERGVDSNVFASFPYRNVRLIQEPDSIGQSFYFVADTGVSTPLSSKKRGMGVRLFIKGANWIPVHSFPVLDEAQKARYRNLLCSAKEAGFNMLRVWGGGIYEHDYFFDLCDSLGLMVWMDFNFSTMLYPDNPEMLESIKEEAEQNIRRIAKHPCVVLWCGNNEIKNGWEDWGWQGVYNWTPEQRARLEKAMDTIFGIENGKLKIENSADAVQKLSILNSQFSILGHAVATCDPLQRPYITTSPLYGWGHPECVTHGDSHYWGVWWGELPFEVYKEKTGRFMSEYGFQSYPMMSTLRRFCPDDQLTIDSPTLRNHQKHGRGLQIIDKAMQQYYGFDSRSLPLEDFVYVSQLLQAWGTGYGIFCHIADPRCSGTLYWQLNDCWPVASWSSIDYYGNWKALHYRAQALFSLTPWCAVGSADNPSPSGEGSEYKKALKKWEQYYSVYPKDRHYPAPKYTSALNIQNSKLEVIVTAESDLYDLYLDLVPHVDGHFTSNFVDLHAGDTLVTTFIPVDPNADLSRSKLSARTLNELYLLK